MIYSRLFILSLFACCLCLISCENKTNTTNAKSNNAAKDNNKKSSADTKLTPTPSKAPKKNPATGKIKKPMIWTFDTGAGPVYLLGTVHMGIDAKKQFPKKVFELLDTSKTFVMETNLAAAQTSMVTGMVLKPEEKNLEEQLGKKYWAELNKRLGNATPYKGMQPWFIVTLLLPKMLPSDMLTPSMDQTLLEHAKAQGKSLGFLETPEFQINMIKQTLTLDELKEMLDDFEQQKKDLLDLMTYYVQGDDKAMEKLSFKDLEKKPERYELLFFKRNNAWVPQIMEHAEKGNAFIAVGAGHLLGDKGVVTLLKNKGIDIKRMEF